METWLPILYVICLYAAFMAGFFRLRILSSKTGNRFRIIETPPGTTLIIVGVLCVCLIFQILYPQLLSMFMRKTELISQGEWWRIFTSLLFQDGGLAGGSFNIVALLFIGAVAEQFWDYKNWLVIFFAGGVLSNLVALSWQPAGAGNSVANFCLAASVAVVCLANRPSLKVHILSLLSLAVGIPFLLLQDIHGAALAIGLFIAIALIWYERVLRNK